MDSFEYFLLIVENWPIYLASICIVGFVYYVIFKKYYISLLDPFTFTSFFSAVAITAPVFLFFINAITSKIFFSFITTQGFFFLGFRMFSPIRVEKISIKNSNEDNVQEIRFVKWFFILIGFTNIVLQLFSYRIFGVPLLAESRLSIYGESGGINNLLKRILDVTLQCHVFITIFFIFLKKKSFYFKIFTNISIVLLLLFSVLSGSKAAFMSFGLAFFIYALYSVRWGDTSLYFTIKRFLPRFGVIALSVAILVIMLSEPGANPIGFLLLRISMSGDIYFMAYPNNIIDLIPKVHWFVALFGGPLSLLEIIPRSIIPEPMGYFINKYHNPGIEFKGPNARMNVFSYVYFGIIYSPLYCFVIGSILSFFRNRLFYLLPSNIFGCIVYYLFLRAALKLEPDFQSALADFINLLVVLPIFLFISYNLSIKNKYE